MYKSSRMHSPDCYVVGDVCLERVEIHDRKAVIYRRSSNIILRQYIVDFEILNAIYTTFKSKKSETDEVHLCLIGEWRIDFHELSHDEHCMLTLPFKICRAHRCSFGLLLERDCFSETCEAVPDSAQLFSLTHPYNEFFPIVSKFKDDVQCYYAFRNHRIALLPNACRYDDIEKREIIYGYNYESNVISVFLLRHCSREEKTSAKSEMWMDARGFFNLSIDSPARVATSGPSFLSPNFFNTKFLSEARRDLSATDGCSITVSPLSAQFSFTGLVNDNFGNNCSFMTTTTSKITPIRRHSMQTRSMVSNSLPRATSAVLMPNDVDFRHENGDSVFRMRSDNIIPSASSMSTLISSEVFTNRRSTNNNLLQYALNQQRRLRCTSTPINTIETEKLLSFGNSNSMECAVEFCLNWIEDLPNSQAELLIQSKTSKHSDFKQDDSMVCNVNIGCNVLSNIYCETPQQAKFYSSNNHLGKELRKSYAERPHMPKVKWQQGLEILDNFFTKKNNAKCNFVYASKLRESSAESLASERKKYCLQRWGDNRLHNVTQMLDSSKSVLIPSKLDDNGSLQQELRDQQIQFLMTTSLKTVTRPFGQALLNFATVRPISNEPFIVNPICFNGKISPSGMQMDYPTAESNTKNLIEWASFYNGIAHGLAVLGFDSFMRRSSNKANKIKRAADKYLVTTEKKKDVRQSDFTRPSTSINTWDIDGSGFPEGEINLGQEIVLSLKKSLHKSQRRLSIESAQLVGTKSSKGHRRQNYSTLTNDCYGESFNEALFEDELLKIRQENCHPNSTQIVFDWNWLCMNLQAHRDIPPVQAGFLFAAGLTGHIVSVPEHDIHKYVEKSEKFKTMAVTLGRAVAFRGTSDVHVYKLLTTHLPFLMQPTLCEFRFEMVVQTAAVVGLGYLFAESMNMSLSSQLINQMSRETFDSDQGGIERYSFVLSAGFAVGLINLGKGKIMANTEPPIYSGHLSLTDRLVKLMNGGERRLCFVHYDNISLCSSTTDGCNLYEGRNNGFVPVRRYADGTTTSADGGNGDVNERLSSTSSHIRQMSHVNIHLTSPAACVALGLMYLRTNDQWISEMLTIPNTFSAIEKIRPDVLMLRVLAKCLINYEQIGVTMKYLEEQIPEIVRKYVFHMLNNSEKNVWWSSSVDLNCVAQAYFYCAAGTCMAMALRYASTSEPNVKQTFECFYSRIEADSITTTSEWEENGASVYRRLNVAAGKNCINACINICALSLALVMAGSGDLSTLQILRKIRNMKRPDNVISSRPTKENFIHSLHLSANMAFGFLCLGNGRLSLAKSNMALASLLISVFPIFPHSLLDNRTYLQPLRFLWTLATETRFLVTVDSESLAPITVDILITFRDENQRPLKDKTPLILPPLQQIAKITLASIKNEGVDEYKPIELNLSWARDAQKLSDVLNRCYGRLPMLKRSMVRYVSHYLPHIRFHDYLAGTITKILENAIENFGEIDTFLQQTLKSTNFYDKYEDEFIGGVIE